MADAMDLMRQRVDDEFGWTDRCLDDRQKLHRAAAQSAVLLLDSSSDDGRSEILHTKLFTLLMGETYRCGIKAKMFFVSCNNNLLGNIDLLLHLKFWFVFLGLTLVRFSNMRWGLGPLPILVFRLQDWNLCLALSEEHRLTFWR